MIGGRALGRVVVVWGDSSQGSGVLLDRRMVLTAWHVVADSNVVEVIHPSSGKPVSCHLGWADKAHDMAVLIAATDVISAECAAPLGRIRIGKVGTGTPLPYCQIVGFPQIQRYGERGEDLEYDQYSVRVLPMAGRMKGALTCELDRSTVDERGSRTSPLRGLSGAPVFAGPVLLGVVTQVPQGRRHLRIEAFAMADVAALEVFGPTGICLEEITEVHPQDEHFEVRYARDLSSQYRKTEIFGIEELGRSESRWDLDTAYLSLRAEAVQPLSSFPVSQLRSPASDGAQRIDMLLTDRPRALLRGEAGAGKTTLVWWLAAHAANGTLSDELAELNGLVPFVIPLREVHARGGHFPTVSELLSAGRVITDGQPDGWVHRVLEARRGLLLVDGLDEVPAEEREEARRWLCTLLDRYPGTRCLATVRPNAVDKQWLGGEHFAELTLLPMSDDDIRAFVHAWHNAARLESDHLYGAGRCSEEHELLTSLEQDLVHQLERNTALRDLARTPLLCAVICALHRRRRGLLPTTRWQLYRAALAMLLGGRDAGRGVLNAARVRLDSDEQHALLQRLAIWLVRTGQQQMTQAQALQQLGHAIRDMPGIQEQGSPEKILRFLLDRSGLLQERADDAIQFIHRTFQDFLAAKEFHESGYLPELFKHARSEAWQDVIVLAAGHAARPDARHLIGTLVDLGDAAEQRKDRYALHVLAARCATNVQSLNPELMEAVKDRVDALMPPRDLEEVEDLAGLGDWVVALLPDAEQLRERVAPYTVQLLARVRSAKARRKLRQCVSHPEPLIRSEAAKAWDFHPLEEFVSEVLEGAHVPDLLVQKHAQLVRLPRLGPVAGLTVRGSYPSKELDAHLPVRQLESLTILTNKVIHSLDFLRRRVDLRSLDLQECTNIRDLSVLQDLDLTSLRLTGAVAGGLVEPLPGLCRLEVGMESIGRFALRLEEWPNLRALSVGGDVPNPSWLLATVRRAPRLTRIALGIGSLHELKPVRPLPCIDRLMITGLQDHTDIGQLRRVFPNLRKLALGMAAGGSALKLRDLQGMPDLQLDIWGDVPERADIEGAEAFGDRLRCHPGAVY
ncbi:NACHT domain-containing protein [Streptomyces sp. ISL-22]|uniref:NACHT domain-containing protein n=1 Tax=unclassified Streptomyces TaxID=2593676 RepID=UPI001BEBF343|nr:MULTISPECIES: NACHT domain-containing protein [unclassified Streptomyces]MBT2420117.1 NACHT domain-containing protein [Streptomyces sp. ISL-24]MBT2433991.1 NACHT domain-containing protein [Streptomyces sp. ISL-22]